MRPYRLSKYIVAILLVFLGFTDKAQDYTRYYELIDSAGYFRKVNNLNQSLTYYKTALKDFDGFPEDYLRASIVSFEQTSELDYLLLARGFRNDLNYRNVLQTLKKQNVAFDKLRLRRLYKANKFKRQTRITPLRKLFLRDQKARLTHKNINITDSLNFAELLKLLIDKPQLFNRKYIGDEWQQKIEVMLLHQHWSVIGPFFEDFRSLVMKGYIERDFLNAIIDRESVFGGYLFKLNDVTRKLEGIPSQNTLICQTVYTSLLGSFSMYYKKQTEKEGRQILIPLNPSYSISEINALRKQLFLCSFDCFNKMTSKQRPEISEFCALMRK